MNSNFKSSLSIATTSICTVLLGSILGFSQEAQGVKQNSPSILGGAEFSTVTVKYRLDRDPKRATSWSRIGGDGNVVAIGDAYGKMRVWDIAMGKVISQLEGGGEAFHTSVSADGQIAVANFVGGKGQLLAWDIATGREAYRVESTLNFALDSSGKNLAVVMPEKPPANAFGIGGPNAIKNFKGNLPPVTIQFRHPKTGELLRQSSSMGDTGIKALAFSPDGSRMAGICTNPKNRIRAIRFWDPGSGKSLDSLPTQNGHFSAMSFSPCGKFLATGSDNKVLEIWDLESGKVALNFRCEAQVHEVAFHPNGKWVAVSTASSDKRISIREVATGRELLSLKCDGAWRGMGFNAAGTQLTAITTECIQAWNLALPNSMPEEKEAPAVKKQ